MSEKYQNLIFVDCEARGVSPVNGVTIVKMRQDDG